MALTTGADASARGGEGESVLLPEANRAGGIEAEWAGDDQQWWDWYVTLAEPTPLGELVDGPPPLRTPSLTDGEVEAALDTPYALTEDAVAAFRRDESVRLPGVLPVGVVARLAARLEELLVDTHGDATAGRFLALEQMWLDDPLMRLIALSPRLGDLAAALLGSDVRLYHDNALSKEPGCGRTPWHHDAEHFPFTPARAVTAWMPVSAVPAEMGPLSFALGSGVRDQLADLAFDKVGTTYDAAVSRRLASSRAPVVAEPYVVGDVSFHSALAFHTAGPNRTTVPRRALATTYLADGVRVVDAPTMVSGAWRDFAPGVEPGGLVASRLNPVVGAGRTVVRVLVDATALVVGDTGVARYAAELLAALPGGGVEVAAVALGRGTEQSRGLARMFGVAHRPVPVRVAQAVWQRVPVPRVEWLGSGPARGSGGPGARPGRGWPQLVHTLDLPPGPTRLPVVMTVHDLDAVAHPDLHPARGVALQRRQVAAARRAAAVCVPSAVTRDALVAAGVAVDRVVVTPLGFTLLSRGWTDVRTGLAGGPGVEPGFVLAVGAVGTRKGHDVLLRALARMPGVRAVLAGPDGHGAEEVRALVGSLGLGDRVRLVGRVRDDELAGLLEAAAVLAFPSRAEGFGLPVLEALGARLPVVASDLPVLREVACGAALHVPVGDPVALATALTAVLAERAAGPAGRGEVGGAGDLGRADIAGGADMADGADGADGVAEPGGGDGVGEAAARSPLAARVRAGRLVATQRTWAACAEATVAAYRLALELGPASPAR